MKTYLFVTTGSNGYVKIDFKCEAQNEAQAVAEFEAHGQYLCMNTAVICLDDIPAIGSQPVVG